MCRIWYKDHLWESAKVVFILIALGGFSLTNWSANVCQFSSNKNQFFRCLSTMALIANVVCWLRWSLNRGWTESSRTQRISKILLQKYGWAKKKNSAHDLEGYCGQVIQAVRILCILFLRQYFTENNFVDIKNWPWLTKTIQETEEKCKKKMEDSLVSKHYKNVRIIGFY